MKRMYVQGLAALLLVTIDFPAPTQDVHSLSATTACLDAATLKRAVGAASAEHDRLLREMLLTQ